MKSLPAELGFPGCALHVSFDAPIHYPALASSTLISTLGVPNDPALVGARLFAQTAAATPAAALLTSNGFGLAID